MSYWYCPNCKQELDGCHVTYQELCEYCGTAVLSVTESISQERLEEIIKAESEGRLVVLDEQLAISMCAGARAIEQNINRMGKRYVYDVRKLEPTIAYLEAARVLREAAEKALGGSDGSSKDE